MLADGLGVLEPRQFEGFTLGKTLEYLSRGLIVLHLPEWRWIRRSLGDQPPPPVLVWLPDDGPLPEVQACLGELRAYATRYPV
jgi:hypothetical protein